MKIKILAFFAISVLFAACSNRHYLIKQQADVGDIEKSIHQQFYAALQQLNLESGITVIPQSLNVKFEHTITNTSTGGFSAFSIVTANYQYQTIADNSATDILAPTKVAAPSGQSGGNLLAAKPCPFDWEQTIKDRKIVQSINDIKSEIETSAKSFMKVPNLGVLNDHQTTLDFKFTYTNHGDISISPLFTWLMFSKINGKFAKDLASTDDIQFTFDIIQNDPSFLDPAAYNAMRKKAIDSKGGICGFFQRGYYDDSTHTKFLTTPPVQDQHGINSCIAYAVGYTAISTILNNQDHPTAYDSNNEYSPDFIYARLTDPKCGGLQLNTVMDEVCKEGDCTVHDFPMVADENTKCETYQKATKDGVIKKLVTPAAGIKNNFLNGWMPLDPNNLDQIRLCLDNDEPVIVAFYESNSFKNMWKYGDPANRKQNVWRTMSGPYNDAHCVVIIGYDNVQKMFKVQNSWGKTNSAADEKNNDAEAGFFWVTYDMIERGCFKEAYTFLPKS